MQKMYIEQVKLLLRVLPEFNRYTCLALKGGTAINLFVRNMPRLSVDLDLAYLPIADRQSSLQEITEFSETIGDVLTQKIPNSHIGFRKTNENYVYQILVQHELAAIKIDINHVIRGTLFPSRPLELCAQAQDELGFYCETNILSFYDLYAGKICAALDRQHPRDFFDIKLLLDNEGLEDDLIEALVVYLISHNRPIHELLAPNFHSFKDAFEREFDGMAFNKIGYTDLFDTANEMLASIHKKLTDRHREFLLSFKDLKPKWELLTISHIQNLPAVKWKMLNLKRLPFEKHKSQLALLEKALNH